jgi:hypothetical protein
VRSKEKKQKSPFELLEELNLIDCLDAEPDLSINYKNKSSNSLPTKFENKKKY